MSLFFLIKRFLLTDNDWRKFFSLSRARAPELSSSSMSWNRILFMFFFSSRTCSDWMMCNSRLKLNCITDIRHRSIHANWLKRKIGLLQDRMTILLVCGILIMVKKLFNINFAMIWQLCQPYESIKKPHGIDLTNKWSQLHHRHFLVSIHVVGIRQCVVLTSKPAKKL